MKTVYTSCPVCSGPVEVQIEMASDKIIESTAPVRDCGCPLTPAETNHLTISGNLPGLSPHGARALLRDARLDLSPLGSPERQAP